MAEEPTKRRHACFVYGCLTGLVLLVVMAIAALIGLRYARKMFYQITDAQPLPLPALQLTETERDQLQQRVDLFRKNVRADKSATPLALSPAEINALIASEPDLKPLRGKLHLTSITEGRLTGLVSLPLTEVGLPVFKGRYLNGTANFAATLHNGTLDLTIQSIVVKGKPLPRVYQDRIRRQNLAANLNEDPRASVALNRLRDIRLEQGQLVLVPKEPEPAR